MVHIKGGIKIKKINSIGYGGRILDAAVAFGLIIPGALKVVTLVYKNMIFTICINVSLGIGIMTLLFLMGLLAVESYQDKQMILNYEAQKNVKLNLGKGIYECQSCGNRTVKSRDKGCSICGMLFDDKGN